MLYILIHIDYYGVCISHLKENYCNILYGVFLGLVCVYSSLKVKNRLTFASLILFFVAIVTRKKIKIKIAYSK
jgi:hypothetical protein